MHKQILLIVSFLALQLPLYAQKNADWRETYNMYFDYDLDEDGVSDNELTDEQAELLDAIAAQPFNINTITQEQLEQFPFLTESEMEAIAYYVYRYNGMLLLSELRLVEYLPVEKARLLEHFLCVGEKERRTKFNLKSMAKYGKQSFFYSANVPLYERKGDVTSPGKGGYLGAPLKHQLRYEFKYGSQAADKPLLRFGLIGANDAGEQFFSGRNNLGYDYYSYYFQLRNRPFLGKTKLQNFVAGCFRASFGMGLVINNNFSLGKSTMMASAGRMATGLRPHTSTSDNNYLHGAGLSLSLSNSISLTVFASHRPINATIGKGDDKQRVITTILSSSYHRTQNEMNKKNTALQTTFGGNLTWKKNRLTLGVSALQTFLNTPLLPNKGQAFRQFYPEGKSFQNFGAHYAYSSRRFSVRGETAVSPKSCSGAVRADKKLAGGFSAATINTVDWKLNQKLSLTALYRYFSPEYTALYGKTFSESTSVQNEQGVFFGANVRLPFNLTAQYYFDFAYFPFPKYQASLPSHSFDNILQLQWSRGSKWSVALRARFKQREYDVKSPAKESSTAKESSNSSEKASAKTQLSWKTTASLRLTVEYKPTKDYWARLNLQQSFYDKDGTRSLGYLAMLRAGCVPVKKFLFLDNPTADLSLGFFNTPDYNTRLYVYERGLTYSFGYQMLYGRGLRSSLRLQSDIGLHFSVAMKFGLTKYFDRKTIGTNMEEIKSSMKNNLEFQLRFRL